MAPSNFSRFKAFRQLEQFGALVP